MTNNLEDLLSETLRGYAEASRDVPGLSEQVARRGQVVRRRRRVAVAAISAVAVLGLSATLLPGTGVDRSAPPAKESAPVVTPRPDPARPELSPEEIQAWLEQLPVGAPTKVTHQTSRGVVVDGRAEYVLMGDGTLSFPISTSEGVYFNYTDADHSGWLVKVGKDGSAVRVDEAETSLDRFLAPNELTFVVGTFPRFDGQTLGPLEIQVRDVESGRVLHTLTRDAGAIIGWISSHVVFTQYGLNGDTVWSWLPGEAPEQIADGFATAAFGSLLLMSPENNRAPSGVLCQRLVPVDQTDVPVVKRCVQAVSPDQELVVTNDYALVNVFDDRLLTDPLPAGLAGPVIGWEPNAFVAEVTYDLGKPVSDNESGSSEPLKVRCRADTGECERVPEDDDLPVVEVRVLD